MDDALALHHGAAGAGEAVGGGVDHEEGGDDVAEGCENANYYLFCGIAS